MVFSSPLTLRQKRHYHLRKLRAEASIRGVQQHGLGKWENRKKTISSRSTRGVETMAQITPKGFSRRESPFLTSGEGLREPDTLVKHNFGGHFRGRDHRAVL
jgi:hypothetical protein